MSQKNLQTKSLPSGYHNRKYWGNIPNREKKEFSVRTITEDPFTFNGYIGVEYVVEIIRPRHLPPSYECTLCQIKTNKYGMEHHIKSNNHREEFLEKHFPSFLKNCWNIREPFRTKMLTATAKEIERYHGRNVPYKVMEAVYDMQREEVIKKVKTFLHASECNGPTSNDLMKNKAIKKYLK